MYKQNADINEELQRANQLLLLEQSKIEGLERDAAWKLLSFTAAHRLGNPMDAIDSELSNLKSAIKLGRNEIIEDIINGMEVPVERAKSIVSEFRNLSIAHEIKPEVTDFDKLKEILKYSAKKAIDKGIKVEFDFQQIPEIYIDIKKMSDCFIELVSNSIHFAREHNPEISISTTLPTEIEMPEKIDRRTGYVKITFRDNGCGIPTEKKEDIFKPFERTYVHGTGLGLAFCDNIIEGHGGNIREKGVPNESAIFEIFLPLIKNKD